MPATSRPSRSRAELEVLRWRARGMDEVTARNLTAYRLGLPPVECGWTPAEQMRLLDLMYRLTTGRTTRG